MTSQTKVRGVRTRTRTLATAGLSAAALVGGLVMAPSAMAAEPTAPTITLTAPAQVSNNWGVTSGSEVGQELGIKVVSTDSADNADLQYRLTVTVPSGVECTNVAITAGTTNSGTAGDTLFGMDASTGLGFSAPTPSSSGQDCIFTGSAGEKVTAGVTDEWSVTVTVTTNDNPTTFDTAPTGDISFKLEAAYGGSSFATASATTALVTPGAATFNAADDIDGPQFGNFYDEAIVDQPGFPANSIDGQDDYVAYGISKTAAGDWNTTDTELRGTSASSASGSAVTVTTDGNVHAYISLSDAHDDSYVTSSQSLTGFFFDTFTGNVVWGTLSSDGTDYTFTKKVVDDRSTSTKYTWTIVANNGSGGWQTGDDQPGSPAPSLSSNDVASPAISLNVGFSDVAPDSVFAEAINALSGDEIILGFGDGTFRPASNVTRGQFAAYGVRMLNEYDADYAGTAALDTGNCAADDPSVFSDVANTNVFCQEIKALAGMGVINGYTNGNFGPSDNITRDQLAAFLFRLNAVVLGTQVNDAAAVDTQFTDVTSSNVFSGDIKWASDNEIVNGFSDTIFKPAANAQRDQAAAMLFRWSHLYGWN